jgi:hypothetical protein
MTEIHRFSRSAHGRPRLYAGLGAKREGVNYNCVGHFMSKK